MTELLMTCWLCLPLAPLNPLEQDTLPVLNLHFSAGIGTPNSVISVGPEFSLKCELLVVHPFVVRGGVDYSYSKVKTTLFPNGDLSGITTHGDLQSAAVGIDAIYYHGTNLLMGYIGLGAIYGFYHYRADHGSSAGMVQRFGIDHVGMAKQPGYRVILGLRYRKLYSLEIVITEIRPKFNFTRDVGSASYATSAEETRLSNFRLTFGYLWTIRR
jgi:hypothetical protein